MYKRQVQYSTVQTKQYTVHSTGDTDVSDVLLNDSTQYSTVQTKQYTVHSTGDTDVSDVLLNDLCDWL